jgi:hypothetical protein
VVTTTATPNDLYFDNFTLPTTDEALADFLSQFGRTARPSPHGHLAATLLGRLESLGDLDILASGLGERIVRLLSRTDESGRLNPRLLAHIASELQRSGRDCGKALSALIRHGFVQRGVQARCSVCQFVDFILLAELDESIQCRGCRARFALPAADDNGRETPISYQLDSLTARTIALDVFPVLQAIRRLVPEGQLAEGHALWPGIEILRTGQRDVELELDTMLGRGQTVTICEAKTRAEGLSLDQVRRIIGFAEEIGAGVMVYASEGDYSTRVRKYAEAHGAQLIS